MKETSVKYMGSLEHGAIFHEPLVVRFEPIEFPVYPETNGDSYINFDLDLAMEQTDPDDWVAHRRSWAAKGSASSPISRIRNGKIQGRYFGDSCAFQTRSGRHPKGTDEYPYSLYIRKVRW